MKFLIAGFGSIGRRHFRNLRSLGVEDIIFFSSNNSTVEREDDEYRCMLEEGHAIEGGVADIDGGGPDGKRPL